MANLLIVTPLPPARGFLDELIHHSHTPYIVNNLEDLKKWSSDDLKVDTVLVDIGHNWQEMILICEIIRQNKQLQRTFLLAVTSNGSRARGAALSAGVDDILTAPLDIVELIHRLQQYQTYSATLQELALGDVDTLGHDLKSPLGTIVPTLDYLRFSMDDADPTLISIVSDALHAANRETRLIDNMLDYMRLQYKSDDLQFDGKPVKLSPFIESLQSQIGENYGRQEVPIDYHLTDSRATIQADAFWLERIFLAILENSLKFCTRQNQIIIYTQEIETQGVITLADTGRAILEDHRESLFSGRNQFASRLAGSRTSLALNLPFARIFTQAMGGQIEAYSDGEWTFFKLSFPLTYNLDS